MSALPSGQLHELQRTLKDYRRAVARMEPELEALKEQLGRIKLICIDHATCDCSAAVMILDVIGDK